MLAAALTKALNLVERRIEGVWAYAGEQLVEDPGRTGELRHVVGSRNDHELGVGARMCWR